MYIGYLFQKVNVFLYKLAHALSHQSRLGLACRDRLMFTQRRERETCVCNSFIVVSLIWSLLNTVFVFHHTQTKFFLNAFPLGVPEVSLDGSLTFKCDHVPALLIYSLNYKVMPNDVVTQVHLLAADPVVNVALGSAFPIPLCTNAALDVGSIYEGPPCPSDNTVCQNEGVGGCMSAGTLTARGSANSFSLESELCRRLRDNLVKVKMFTKDHPAGVAIGNLKQLNTNA
jgi:hypothetical protein